MLKLLLFKGSASHLVLPLRIFHHLQISKNNHNNKNHLVNEGILTFNKDHETGISFLVDHNIIKKDPEDVVRFLTENIDRLDKEQIGLAIGSNQEFYTSVLKYFANAMDFSNMEFDQALRKYLQNFKLPGEAQKISRIIEAFAGRYMSQNPTIFPDADAAFIVSFSLIMLNTDAHNPSVQTKMTLSEFIRNHRGIWAGKDPPPILLEKFYYSIITQEIKFPGSPCTDEDTLCTGWVKHVQIGTTGRKTGPRYLVMNKNQLSWYKKSTKLQDETPKAKLKLSRLIPKTDEIDDKKITISYSLGGNYLEIDLPDRNGKFAPHFTDKLFITLETTSQVEIWIQQISKNTKFNPLTPQIPRHKSILNQQNRRKSEGKVKRSVITKKKERSDVSPKILEFP
eukprot:TRINITY_DN4589_c0_g2_i2.p1 TRINITY_DN4589_c0_g2~~TRINITY_DN4589_c0_g2_i2.p1  ORF type:complete len:396 (+),score=74.99 TRINITY_DN4589_c0_g2_i2:310-1497(+)